MALARPAVLFRVAAGPRVGFGHLVRCRSLARAMGVAPVVSIRGGARTRLTATALGWTVVPAATGLDLRAYQLVVVDDPRAREAGRWVRRAQRLGVPVATIHDLGIGRVDADLTIDGSVDPGPPAPGGRALRGPRYAILDPAIARLRSRRPAARPAGVVIALGGGAHVRALAGRLAAAIAARVPGADIRVARGFSAAAPPVLAHGRWLAPDALAGALTRARAAVVAGGVTLYEACALGVPVVALAVTPAQHRTVRAMARAGAVRDAGRPPVSDTVLDRAAGAVASLLADDRASRRQTAVARHLVDGLGAARVARQLTRMAVPHAA